MKRTPLGLLGLYQPSWETKNIERTKITNKFELKGKSIFLDGEHLKGVQSFKLKSTAESSHAELYLKLLVELPRDDISNDLRSNT